MKTLFLSLFLVIGSFTSFAQLPGFGIKGGVNFPRLSTSSQNNDPYIIPSTLTTFFVAAFIDFKFGNFSYQPGVNFTGKGGQTFYKGLPADGIDVTEKVKLYYLQVPMNVVYHLPVVIGNLYLGAGPYAAVGTSGKIKYLTSATSKSQDVKFGSNGDFKATDFGAGIIAGFQFNTGLLIGLNYDLGLSNISNDGNTKNRVFGVSAGFVF